MPFQQRVSPLQIPPLPQRQQLSTSKPRLHILFFFCYASYQNSGVYASVPCRTARDSRVQKPHKHKIIEHDALLFTTRGRTNAGWLVRIPRACVNEVWGACCLCVRPRNVTLYVVSFFFFSVIISGGSLQSLKESLESFPASVASPGDIERLISNNAVPFQDKKLPTQIYTTGAKRTRSDSLITPRLRARFLFSPSTRVWKPGIVLNRKELRQRGGSLEKKKQ